MATKSNKTTKMTATKGTKNAAEPKAPAPSAEIVVVFALRRVSFAAVIVVKDRGTRMHRPIGTMHGTPRPGTARGVVVSVVRAQL